MPSLGGAGAGAGSKSTNADRCSVAGRLPILPRNTRKLPQIRLDPTVVGTIVSSLVGQAVLVVSGVIVARALGPHDRGLLASFVLVSTVTMFFVSAGVPISATLEIAAGRRSVRGILNDLSTVISIQSALAIVVPLAVLIGLFHGTDAATAALCTTPLALAALMWRYGLALVQGRQRFLAFNYLRLAPAVLYSAGVVALLMAGFKGLTDYSLVYTAGSLAGGILALYVALRGEAPDPGPRGEVRPLVAYGAKAQIGAASPLESLSLDQIAVGALLGSSPLGLYVVASALTNLPRFIAQSIGIVLFPRVAERLESGGKRRIVLESLALAALLCGAVVAVMIVLVSSLIPFLFGDAYRDSITAARVLLIGAFFLSMRRVIGDALRGAELPMPATLAEVTSWVVFVIAIVPLTAQYGIVGAAAAMALSAAVSVSVLVVQVVLITSGRRSAARS